MNALERIESERMNARLDAIMAEQECDITSAARIYKNEQREFRYQREVADRKKEQARDELVSSYETRLGKTHGEAVKMADEKFPQARKNYGAIHDAASIINNPGGNEPETFLSLMTSLLKSEPARAKAVAGEYIAELAEVRANNRPGEFRSVRLSEATREILAENSDCAAMYQNGVVSEGAIRKIFHFRFLSA